MRVAHALASAAIGAGLGVQVFLSFIIAPAAFRLIDRPQAVRLMEGVFPAYYSFGLVTLALALVLVGVLALRERTALRWASGVLLAATLAGTGYAGHVLLPEAQAARLRAQAAPAGDLSPLVFSRLHRRAVGVNIALCLSGAVAFLLHAGTRVPERASPDRSARAARHGSAVN